MLIAISLAIALHVGLINFEFIPKPISVPVVSLPRSVSVFLNQKSMVETSLQQIEEAQNAEHFEKQPAAEINPEKSVTENTSHTKEKTESPVQKPALMNKTVKQYAAEEIVPASQKPNDIAENIKPEPGEAAKAQKPVTQAEQQTAQQNDGGSLPGTLQMAYPRYQLNIPPAYPGLARKRSQEGTVILQVLVNEKGRVDDLEIKTSSSYRLLDRAAVSAVRKWNFEPGRRGDEKIPMWVRVPVTFKLK